MMAQRSRALHFDVEKEVHRFYKNDDQKTKLRLPAGDISSVKTSYRSQVSTSKQEKGFGIAALLQHGLPYWCGEYG